MNAEQHIREYLKFERGYSICHCLDFWGENMVYYGCYENHIYTEGFRKLKELIKEYPELKYAIR